MCYETLSAVAGAYHKIFILHCVRPLHASFTTDTEQRFQNNFAATEPNYSSHDRHDRPSNDAGCIPLG